MLAQTGMATYMSYKSPATTICRYCEQKYTVTNDGHRTFATPQDFHDLVAKMAEKGDWVSFYNWAFDKMGVPWHGTFCGKLYLYPENCQLVADWLKGKEEE